MPMKNSPHPGGFVLRQCIEPLGLSITEAAAALGVTPSLSTRSSCHPTFGICYYCYNSD